MTDQPLPPCGCRTGCQHRLYPQLPAQRDCRAGIVPRPATLARTPEQAARARWDTWRHLRTLGATDG